MTERAVPMDVPGVRWSAGAPEPLLLSSESRTLLAFYRDDRDVVDGNEVLVVDLVGCLVVRAGFPNDEALHGHRLWGRGLAFYALHQVEESQWLDELRRIESVHPQAAPTPWPEAQHLVMTFHDSTIEAVVTGRVTVVAEHRTMAEAMGGMLAALAG